MTTQRRARLYDDEEDDGGDDDATISGWGTSDFDATIFAHATAAVADRRFTPKPKPTPAVASHQTTNEQQQQQHDKQKTKKTLHESDVKSPHWNSEALRLAEDLHSPTSNSIKISKAQLVTTQITTFKTSLGHDNNNHPSNIHNSRMNNHHSNNNISKTALVSREFAVSAYAVPTKLLQPKELSPNRRRHRRRPPHNLQQQQQQTEPTKGRFICKIVGLIDDEEQKDTNLWRLPPALRKIEAFQQHHTHPKYRENTFLLPPLLHGSNSVDSLLASLSK